MTPAAGLPADVTQAYTVQDEEEARLNRWAHPDTADAHLAEAVFARVDSAYGTEEW